MDKIDESFLSKERCPICGEIFKYSYRIGHGVQADGEITWHGNRYRILKKMRYLFEFWHTWKSKHYTCKSCYHQWWSEPKRIDEEERV